jgi:uncharacterized SAM-binding protein YcdF (DUF218 family)
MNALLAFVFSASGPIVALLVSAIWLQRTPASRGARRLLSATAAFCLVASLQIVPYSVSRLLTFGYHRFRAGDVPPGPTAIVLLGGGDELVAGWADQLTITTPTEGARVLEAARVYRMIAPVMIVSSGGRPDSLTQVEPSSTTMRDELVRMGVPANAIVLESVSRNSHENAALVVPILQSRGIQHVVLVTSDTHMRRAIGAMRAVGITPIPALAPDPRLPVDWYWWILPTSDSLEASREVAREILAIPYYFARGWWK